MKNSIVLLRGNRMYFTVLLILMLSCFLVLSVNVNDPFFISLNAHHPVWLNVFFINYTFIGDGIFAISLIALLFFYFKRKQTAITFLFAFLIQCIFVQLIKNISDPSGPKLFFEQGQYLFYTGKASLSYDSSFPSGHTAVIFAFATVLILLVKNKSRQLPVLLAALLGAYSRMYLAGHLLPDVMIGAVLGCVAGITAVYLVVDVKRFNFPFHRMQAHKQDPVIPSFN